MPDAPADNRMLVRRTLIAVGAMVGACIVGVGAMTLLAVSFVQHSLAAPPSEPAAGASPSPSATSTVRYPRSSLRPGSPAASQRTAESPQKTR